MTKSDDQPEPAQSGLWVSKGLQAFIRVTRGPWIRVGPLIAVITLGFSQIFYNMIVKHLRWFPMDLALYGWVIVWVALVPLIVVLGIDMLCGRRGTDTLLFRGWRVLLYSFLAVSLLRQAQIYHNDLWQLYLGFAPTALWFVLGAMGVGVLCGLAPRISEQYFAILGFAGVYLTAAFVIETGWHRAEVAQSVSTASGSQFAEALPEAPPVFILLADELSLEALLKDDQIDEERFPNFARLANDATWVRNAAANYAVTAQAIPSLLTGRSRSAKTFPTIFERLAVRYRTVVVESDMSVERWLRTRPGIDAHCTFQGTAHLLSTRPLLCARYLYENLMHTRFFRDTPRRTLHNSPSIHVTFPTELEQVLGSIRGQNADGRLTYWHFAPPHAPFVFSRDGTRHDLPHRAYEWRADEAATWRQYREQIQFVDHVLGRFVDRLKDEGLYDRAVLVITSDHGLRKWKEPNHKHVELTAEVPMFIRAPGLARGTLDRGYQHLDLAPTLLDLLGSPYEPSDFEGVSLTRRDRPTRETIFEYRRDRFRRDPENSKWHLVEGVR